MNKIYDKVPFMPVSFYGLNCWFKTKIEKFGWILLAHCETQKDMISDYEKDLKRLYRIMFHSLDLYQEVDTIHDIRIMMKKIKYFIKILDHMKEYKYTSVEAKDLIGGNSVELYIRVPVTKCTFNGMNNWFEQMVEKTGWKIMCMCQGSRDKIDSFMKTLRYLSYVLIQNSNTYNDEDKRHDINIMIEKVQMLYKILEHMCSYKSEQILIGGKKSKKSKKYKKSKKLKKSKKQSINDEDSW